MSWRAFLAEEAFAADGPDPTRRATAARMLADRLSPRRFIALALG